MSYGEAQQHGKTHMLPPPSLALKSLRSGVIPGAERCGWVMHRGRAAVLGHSDITLPQVCSEPRAALASIVGSSHPSLPPESSAMEPGVAGELSVSGARVGN